MRILVLGGTGKVGSVAVSELVRSGADVRLLVRDPAKANVPGGVELVTGNLENDDDVARAFAGVDRAGLVPPLHPQEGALLLRAVRAAAREEVERLALISVFRLEALPEAVHLTGKREAEAEIARLGIPSVVLRPNNFFQNDLMVLPMIAAGAYPVPLGPIGGHGVDTRDVGAALAKALLEDTVAAPRIPVVGAEGLSGPGAAAVWSRVLEREVRYVSSDLDAWAAGMRTHAPGWLVDALLAMYRAVAANGTLAEPAEVAETERFLGRPARRYEDFVREAAAGL